MTRKEFENIIAFCVLMQGDGGLMMKYPNYVKYCLKNVDVYALDRMDFSQYEQYMDKWKGHMPKFEGDDKV